MTIAQPALNPIVEIWATPTHIFFDMFVDKPDDPGEANQWRIGFNSNNFRSHIRDAVLAVLDEVEAGTFEQKHTIKN